MGGRAAQQGGDHGGQVRDREKRGRQFTFNLKAGNGQVLLTSEGYSAKANATNGIESVRRDAADDARFERRTATNGKPCFALTATNGQIIGRSQVHADTGGMENGIRSVRENAADATVEDLS